MNLIKDWAQQTAQEFSKAYSAFIESEMIKALEHIEGSIPGDKHLSKHGESFSHPSNATGGQELSYHWKGKEILRFSPPRVSDEGKLLVGVDRWYLESNG